MLELIGIALPFAIGGGTFYLVYRMSIKRIEQVNQQFQVLGDSLNCQVTQSQPKLFKINRAYPRIDGQIDGKKFYAHIYTVGSGKNQRTYTAFSLDTTNRYSYTFTIYKEGFFSKMGKGLGMQDIQVEDEDFDKQFMLKSNDDYFLKSILDEALKSHFLQNYDMMKGEFKLKGDEVIYSVLDQINTKTKRLDFEQLVYLGSAISDAVTLFSESHKPPGL